MAVWPRPALLSANPMAPVSAPVLALVPMLLGGLLTLAPTPASAPAPAPAPAPLPAATDEAHPSEAVISLYGCDAFLSTLDLDLMAHGGELVEGEFILDDIELVFGTLAAGKLSFGFRRDELALLVPLGPRVVTATTTSSDLAPRPPVSVYHTLRVKAGKVVYTRPLDRVTRLKDAQAIFGNFPTEGAQQLEPQAGSVYLLRLRAPKLKGGGERFFKFLVLEADSQKVTLRIAPLGQEP